LKACPSAEKSPVRESEAPIEIGAVDAGDELLAAPVGLAAPVELLLLLLLLHAARTPTESATAPSVTAFLENQGRCALTPGSSFLIVMVLRVRVPGCLRVLAIGGDAGKFLSRAVDAAKKTPR
jgi:hypothetical protein